MKEAEEAEEAEEQEDTEEQEEKKITYESFATNLYARMDDRRDVFFRILTSVLKKSSNSFGRYPHRSRFASPQPLSPAAAPKKQQKQKDVLSHS